MLIKIPANKLCNKYVIITSKRRFDVIITYLLRFLFVGYYWICSCPLLVVTLKLNHNVNDNPIDSLCNLFYQMISYLQFPERPVDQTSILVEVWLGIHQAITRTNVDAVHWHIYMLRGLNLSNHIGSVASTMLWHGDFYIKNSRITFVEIFFIFTDFDKMDASCILNGIYIYMCVCVCIYI